MSSQHLTEASFASLSTERRIADLTVLYEVSRALQLTLDEEKTLFTILTGVTHGRGLGFNRGYILLVNSQTQVLEGRLAVGPSTPEEAEAVWQDLRRKHQNLGEILHHLPPSRACNQHVNEIVARFRVPLCQTEDILIRIMRSREALRANEGYFDPLDWPVDPQLAEMLEVRNFAVAPLYHADHEFGLLIADNALTRTPITRASLKLLQIYAQIASASIQNLRLFSELSARIGTCEDANRRLLENQNRLLQAERLATIGKMAALLAHEIKTPLVSIGGFARRLLRHTPPEDRRKEETEIIISEVTRLERLVGEVLGYTRISKPEYESTDINGLIKSILVTMQERLGQCRIRTVLELDPVLPAARVDRFQIHQALMNLIDNAVDAMPSGGTLRLATLCQNTHLEVAIADTGIGIMREHWEKLFVPFFTTKPNGTGLGLAVVSQIIENHKGSLRFESSAGQGTTFYIRLVLDPEGISTEPNPL